jgi:predicted nuclease of predicted toxin-antitoxin system
MKFLIDAQLPRRLARRLDAAGHDAIHTLDLPAGNRTADADVLARADRDGRAVVTKDADFVSSFVVGRRPARLILVSVGNVGNAELETRFFANLATITDVLSAPGLVELTVGGLVVHEG